MQPKDIELVCGRRVGNTDASHNVREDVLRVLNRLHVLWSLTNAEFDIESNRVGRLDPGAKVDASSMAVVASGLLRNERESIAAAPAARFLNRGIQKATGLDEVGRNLDNLRSDVQSIQDGLLERGLMVRGDYERESQDVQRHGGNQIPSSIVPKTLSALALLKHKIARGDWGWAPIRADEASDDGDRYYTQTFDCDRFSVFIPTGLKAEENSVHLFFSPAGVTGGRGSRPANEILVHGLRNAFDPSAWILIGVPGDSNDAPITNKDIRNCLLRGGRNGTVTRIRLSAYSSGHQGLAKTIKQPLSDFEVNKIERIFVLDAEYKSLTDAFVRANITSSTVVFYRVTVPSLIENPLRLAQKVQIPKDAIIALGYARAIDDAKTTRVGFAGHIPEGIRDQLPKNGLLQRGNYTASAGASRNQQTIQQFGAENRDVIRLILKNTATSNPANIKEFVDRNDCLWYGFIFVGTRGEPIWMIDAHHFFVAEIAHELVQ